MKPDSSPATCDDSWEAKLERAYEESQLWLAWAYRKALRDVHPSLLLEYRRKRFNPMNSPDVLIDDKLQSFKVWTHG